MKEKKTVLLLIATSIILGCLFIPCVSTALLDQREIPLQIGDTTGYRHVQLDKIDRSLKNATPYWLTLVATPEEQDLLLRFIDNSSVSKQDKVYYKNSLISLWERYPLEFRDEGNFTNITFKNKKAKHVLSSDENETIKRIAALIGEGGQATFPNKAGSTESGAKIMPSVPFIPIPTSAPNYPEKNSFGDTEWGPLLQWSNQPTHNGLIFVPVYKLRGFNDANVAANTADDPDYWDFENQPWFVPQEFLLLVHGWNHYYNPDAAFGDAAIECAGHTQMARTNFENGNLNAAFSYLGWASHYLTDICNPMHTGGEWDQLPNPSLHSNYENYVNSRYYSKYYNMLWSDPYYYPLDRNNPAEPMNCAIYSASLGHDCVDTLIRHVRDSGGNYEVMDQDGTIQDITINQHLLAYRMCYGFTKYIGV